MRLWNFVSAKSSREKGMNQRKGTRGSSGELTAIVKPGEWLSAVVIMELNLELTQNLITESRSGREQHKFEFTCFFIIKKSLEVSVIFFSLKTTQC